MNMRDSVAWSTLRFQAVTQSGGRGAKETKGGRAAPLTGEEHSFGRILGARTSLRRRLAPEGAVADGDFPGGGARVLRGQRFGRHWRQQMRRNEKRRHRERTRQGRGPERSPNEAFEAVRRSGGRMGLGRPKPVHLRVRDARGERGWRWSFRGPWAWRISTARLLLKAARG